LDVTLVSEAAAHRLNDNDLVLLDDVEIGHADMQETRAIETETG
jgi:hypothetical protein